MTISDLKAWPSYARLRRSIDAHLQIVAGAYAMSRSGEETADLSIQKFMGALRAYHESVTTFGRHQVKTMIPSK